MDKKATCKPVKYKIVSYGAICPQCGAEMTTTHHVRLDGPYTKKSNDEEIFLNCAECMSVLTMKKICESTYEKILWEWENKK